jgi:hypothetical protein
MTLCLAFESFLAINQDNGDVRVRVQKKLGTILQHVVYGEASKGETQAHGKVTKIKISCALSYALV